MVTGLVAGRGPASEAALQGTSQSWRCPITDRNADEEVLPHPVLPGKPCLGNCTSHLFLFHFVLSLSLEVPPLTLGKS